jgi:hypothetical protein
MHAVGLHSALAIKRQRKRRDEQKRAKERRYSTQSTESGIGESRSSCASPRNSIASLERRRGGRLGYRRPKRTNQTSKVVSNMGMLHIGVVFLVLGMFLFGSGLVPDDFDDWSKNYQWFNELVVSGVACMLVGIFFIVLNAVITRKEEKDLSEYVQRQLTRSKSGHRLVRDVETGNLTTKRDKRGEDTSLILDSEKFNGTLTPPLTDSPTLKSPPALSESTPRSDLERILEEEFSEKGDEECRETTNLTCGQEQHRVIVTTRYFNNMEIYDN